VGSKGSQTMAKDYKFDGYKIIKVGDMDVWTDVWTEDQTLAKPPFDIEPPNGPLEDVAEGMGLQDYIEKL
jgi:hypothetical protein